MEVNLQVYHGNIIQAPKSPPLPLSVLTFCKELNLRVSVALRCSLTNCQNVDCPSVLNKTCSVTCLKGMVASINLENILNGRQTRLANQADKLTKEGCLPQGIHLFIRLDSKL
jgi:hypothetical protein